MPNPSSQEAKRLVNEVLDMVAPNEEFTVRTIRRRILALSGIELNSGWVFTLLTNNVRTERTNPGVVPASFRLNPAAASKAAGHGPFGDLAFEEATAQENKTGPLAWTSTVGGGKTTIPSGAQPTTTHNTVTRIDTASTHQASTGHDHVPHLDSPKTPGLLKRIREYFRRTGH
jgi:hypothetical protein